jgi:hypothetical protein
VLNDKYVGPPQLNNGIMVDPDSRSANNSNCRFFTPNNDPLHIHWINLANCTHAAHGVPFKLSFAQGYANAGVVGATDYAQTSANFDAIESDYARDEDATSYEYTCYWYTRRKFALLPIGGGVEDMRRAMDYFNPSPSSADPPHRRYNHDPSSHPLGTKYLTCKPLKCNPSQLDALVNTIDYNLVVGDCRNETRVFHAVDEGVCGPR